MRVKHGEQVVEQRIASVSVDAPPSLAADLRARVGSAAEVVVTTSAIEGVPQPGAVVADRWGEIHHVTTIDPTAPDLDDLVEWVRFVRMQCPECQGEAR